ncbi:hypothetical protein LBMAG37_04920 [Anaerolineae bacterium]|nr:hypothetical protein EMGBS3_09860 [Anaerolineaceae bacterium]GBL38499.1 hypothetical protein EMGBD1_21860 [Anaerolineaceae bacterium]GDX67338.1 hypothetical protein LBMAG37_04920 [Anaerolineae bacterium]
MFVQLVHAGLTNTLLLYTLALAGWSFVIFFRRSEITPAYWGAFAICCGMFGLQFVLGLLLALGSGTDVRWVHYLYGTLGVITLPAAFGFTRGRGTFQEALVYAVVLLFIAGVVARARVTAVLALPGL